MTNKEKFIEVFKETFGFRPSKDWQNWMNADCIAPAKVCETLEEDSAGCSDCPFDKWWDKEYKPCFSLREDLNE